MRFTDNETELLSAPDISDVTKRLIGRFVFISGTIVLFVWFGDRTKEISVSPSMFDLPIKISLDQTLIILILILLYEGIHLFFLARLDIRKVREAQQDYIDSFSGQISATSERLQQIEHLLKDLLGSGPNAKKLEQNDNVKSYLNHFEESNLPEIKKQLEVFRNDFKRYCRYKERVNTSKNTYSRVMVFILPVFMAIVTMIHLVMYVISVLPVS